jgi:hypothetical protein
MAARQICDGYGPTFDLECDDDSRDEQYAQRLLCR